MPITGRTLFAFVDPKDPFMATEVADEDQPGPILSLMGARQFDFLFLFHTPHTRENASATQQEVERRYPGCRVSLHELPVSDPKDYSSLMGCLAREVREIVGRSQAENSVCVSSGTAEMRAAWFLLTAVGALPATLLQVGSPADPLFGAASVKEVRLDLESWASVRDLVMPQQYFESDVTRMLRRGEAGEEAPEARLTLSAPPPAPARVRRPMRLRAVPGAAPAVPDGLEAALQELGIFTGSAVLRDAAERAAIAADCDVPVLLLGETGTGKELFAKLIHRMSSRRNAPMISVNCAAVPKEIAESFLFGHIKGAFTGATTDQKGKFELAHGGTLFLDELAELTPDAQAKLLRVVQDGMVEPLGASKARSVDVRIVAATNRKLQDEVAAGRFRDDLYYRLEVVQIVLPPLRERREEIPKLAAALLRRINQRRKRTRQLSPAALRRLEQHAWPGNVRELSNVLERSVLYARSDVLAPEDLVIHTAACPDPLAGLPDPCAGFDLNRFLEQVRNQLMLRALEKSGGNQSAAAALLGVSKQAVHGFVKGQGGNSD